MTKRLLVLSYCCILLLLLTSRDLHAQPTSSFTHTVTSTLKSGQQPARDFWLTMAQNYDAGGGNGKYYMLYISSETATRVHVQITGSSDQSFGVQAQGIVAFKIPLSWEVTSSGLVENKGIRVWSYDADLSVYELSRNPATSDGMYVIPTVGWGKDYVVAAYSSLFELSFDYPSEFSIVAAADNTSVSITPSTSIRDREPNSILHMKDTAFGEFLMRGQCVQYKALQAMNPTDYDMTGSIVKSNIPIGVVGASMCPNIPADYAYCDHICDMIPPIRTWGQTYYSLPFARRKGGDSFRVIASTDNQRISRVDNKGSEVFAQLNKYTEPNISTASRWTSDQPFLLVQYINSTTYPDGTGTLNGSIGDPAMVVLNSTQQFGTNFLLQTPTILGGQNRFTNYVNVVLPKSAEQTTFYDSTEIDSITNATKFSVDTAYDEYMFPDQLPGKHSLRSSQPVGGYVYGYGTYDSYAWPIALGTNSLQVTDTIAPTAKEVNSCLCSHITIADLNLSEFVLDSSSNMSYQPDASYEAGMGANHSFYDLCVINPDTLAVAFVSVYDVVGNRTQIKSVFQPIGLKLSKQSIFFTDSVETLEIYNVGRKSYALSSIHLANGHGGFSIGQPATDTLRAGDSLLLSIRYFFDHTNRQRDTLLLTDSCVSYRVELIGGGWGAQSIAIRDTCLKVGDSALAYVHVTNLTEAALTLTSVVPIDIHFKLATTLPIVIPKGASVDIPFMFKPTNSVLYTTSVVLVSSASDTVQTSITRCAKFFTMGVDQAIATNEPTARWLRNDDASNILLLPPHPNPSSRETGKRVTFTIGLRERASISFVLYDLLGRQTAVISNDLWHPEGVTDLSFDVGKFAAGTYVYRFEALGEVRSGKLVIGK